MQSMSRDVCGGGGQRNKVMKYGEGAPESLLSMGPERPRYATGKLSKLGGQGGWCDPVIVKLDYFENI